MSARLSDTALQGARIGVYGPGWNSVTLSPETQTLFQHELDVLVAQGATLVTDPFLGSGYRELNQGVPSSNTFSYDINQYFARHDESLINSVAEFDAAVVRAVVQPAAATRRVVGRGPGDPRRSGCLPRPTRCDADMFHK